MRSNTNSTAAKTDARPVHLRSQTDDWPTPQEFYNRLDTEFCGFSLDVCSSTRNHKAPGFYALDHEDPNRRDGLAQDWALDASDADTGAPGCIWMNPPYGRGIDKWMAKAHEAAQKGATVVCLVPVRANTHWWHDYVLNTGAEVRYLRGRLRFGNAAADAPFANAVVIYRPDDKVGAPGRTRTMLAKVPSVQLDLLDELGAA